MAKGAWKMTAARKAYYASKKKAKKAFASEYKKSRKSFGGSKHSAITRGLMAAGTISPAFAKKKAKAYGKSLAKRAGYKGAGIKTFTSEYKSSIKEGSKFMKAARGAALIRKAANMAKKKR
jgi:hypothetical protein